MAKGQEFSKNIGVFLSQFQPREPNFLGEIMIMTFPINVGDLPPLVIKKGQRKKSKTLFLPEIIFIAEPDAIDGRYYNLKWVYHSYQIVQESIPLI